MAENQTLEWLCNSIRSFFHPEIGVNSSEIEHFIRGAKKSACVSAKVKTEDLGDLPAKLATALEGELTESKDGHSAILEGRQGGKAWQLYLVAQSPEPTES